MSERSASYEIDMCNGPLFNKIIKYSLPLIASGFLQFCYNIVNTAMLGYFNDEDALAAVGSTGSLISLFTSLFMGLSVGVNVLVAHSSASEDKHDIHETVHTAVLTSFIIGIFIAVSGFFISRTLLVLTNTPSDILDKANVYMQIYFIGFIGSSVTNFSNAILYGIGDTRRPFYISLATSSLHVLLNLLFIVVLKMEVIGVAISTSIIQFLNAIAVLILLIHSKTECRLQLSKLKISKDKLKKMMIIGIPSGLQSTATGVTNTMVQSAVNSFGVLIVAGNTAANNLGNLVFICINAFHRTALTFVGQNYSAGKIKRVLKSTYICLASVTVIGIFAGGLLYIFAEPLLKIYVTDKTAISAGILRIVIVYLTHSLYGWTDVFSGVLRGMGHSALAMTITMSGLCGFTIVWIYTVFQYSHNLITLYAVYPVAWIITSIAYIICLRYLIKKIAKKHRIYN